MKGPFPLHLFTGYGIELEFMIVDRDTLHVRPIADMVIAAAAGHPASEVDFGDIGWSNELAMHVLEMKTNGPASRLPGVAERFQEQVRHANALLEPHGAMLMPTAMHPWMDPAHETRLWPHEQNEIYRAYDRIFGTRGHGWSNLQSAHLNLPFGSDEEFVRLHAAVRVVLPLIPAIAASSPVVDSTLTGLLDTRLEVYRMNQKAVPSIGGRVVPETVRSIDEYHERILAPMYRDIAPHDPAGILQEEWLNSRGAIARFDRGAIEIRVVDLQESPRADLAVAAAIVAAVRALAEERWVPLEELHAIAVDPLADLLLEAIRGGEATWVGDERILRAFGVRDMPGMRATDLWAYLVRSLFSGEELAKEGWGGVYRTLFSEGTLARRIVTALGPAADRKKIAEVYRMLCGCLANGKVFHAGGC